MSGHPKLFKRFLQNLGDAMRLEAKFFGTSPLELQALEAIQFGITENGKKVWFLPEGYRAICKAIAKGEMFVRDEQVPTAEAAYDFTNDGLLVNPNLFNSTVGRSKVVHELTHAIVDVRPAIGWTFHTNECAAFIAQAIYLKVTKTPTPVFANDLGVTAVYRDARALVDSFGFGDNTVGYGGITPNDPEMVRLRKAVADVYLQYKPHELMPVTEFGLRSKNKIDTGQTD